MRISDWSSDVCSSDLPFRTIGVIDARDFHELLISQIVAQLHHDGRKCLALDRDADLTNSFNEFDNSISQQGVDGISHTFVGGIFGCGTAHISVRSFQCDEFSVGAASRRKEALLLSAGNPAHKYPPTRSGPSRAQRSE